MGFRFINFFRALAAFWVLAAHVQIWGGHTFVAIPSPKYGVDLFMLVSGFLMVAMTEGRWDREPLSDPGSRLRFWIRRFFRIAPAYYVALLVIFVGQDFFLAGKSELQALQQWKWEIGGPYDPATVNLSADNLLAHVTFLFGLFPQYASATSLPDWSLSLEMQFYFFFPFLLLFVRRFGVPALLLLTVGVYLVGRWYAAGAGYPEPSLLAMKLHVFVAGMLLHASLKAKGSRRIGILAGALFLSSLGSYSLTVPGMVLLMFAAGEMEASGDNPLAWLTDNAVVRFASDVSYGVYLFQGFFVGTFGVMCLWSPWLQQAGPQARTALMFGFVVVGAYTAGWLVHRYVELPGIALGKMKRLRTA